MLKQGYVQLSTYFATTVHVVQILVKLNWANPLHKIYRQNEGSKRKIEGLGVIDEGRRLRNAGFIEKCRVHWNC